MLGPSVMSIRGPAVAGAFYPADPARCEAEARRMVSGHATAPRRPLMGAMVPHAGWICSGRIAGEALAALAANSTDVDTVIVFAAVHTPIRLDVAALDTHDVWTTPGRRSMVAEELRMKLAEGGGLFAVDDRFHARDHAVEVELPLIGALFPGAMILPVEVPVTEDAPRIGKETAMAAMKAGLRPVYLASSDLTHYGPNYRFVPAGVGAAALEWAKENDRRLLDVIAEMKPEAVVPEVRERQNACGAGAIAAMLAACREHGAAEATLLRHSTSFETLAAVAPQPSDNSVGYAAVVVG